MKRLNGQVWGSVEVGRKMKKKNGKNNIGGCEGEDEAGLVVDGEVGDGLACLWLIEGGGEGGGQGSLVVS